jgi:anti-sigma B factor antagonist
MREPPISVEILEDGPRGTLVRVGGELDAATVPIVEHELSQLSDGETVLTIDLSQVSFMDSSGIAMLLNTRNRSGGLHIRNASAPVRLVIEATGLANVLPMTP